MDLKDLLHEIITYGRIASESGRLHTLIEDVLGAVENKPAPAAQEAPAEPPAEPAPAQVWQPTPAAATTTEPAPPTP